MIFKRLLVNLNLNSLAIYIGVSSAVFNPALAFAPIIVGGLITTLGFSIKAAVIITSAELLASTFSFLLALWWMNKVPWRKVATISIVAIILGNFLSVFCSSFNQLLLVRILCGVFEGNLLILYLLVAAQVSQTEQLFGGKLALQMITIVFGLATLPFVVTQWSIAGVYTILTLVACVLFFGIKLLPNNDDAKPSLLFKSTITKPSPWGGVALLMLLMFAAGINSVWTYLERIGDAHGFSIEFVGVLLSCALSISICCGLLASRVGLRFGRAIPIAIGLLSGILGCLILKIEALSLIYFSLGVFLIAITKALPLPYLFGTLALLDVQKHLTVFSHVVLSLGMSIGPLLAIVLFRQTGYESVLVFSIVILSITLALALKLLIVINKSQCSNQGVMGLD
ncbi:MAG: MFS transporter [Acidiferrobacterales bacterium]|nr:MFS transporter [Acidiferrobacterales bacterium]